MPGFDPENDNGNRNIKKFLTKYTNRYIVNHNIMI